MLAKRQLVLLSGGLLLVTAAYISISSYLSASAASSTTQVDLHALYNVSLKSEQLDWLKAQAHKEEIDLIALTKKEKEQQEEVAASLKELLVQRETLTAKRDALEANRTALEGEIAELRNVEEDIASLLKERATLLADKERLEEDQRALTKAKATLAESRGQFKANVEKLAEDQAELENKLQLLRAEHKDAKKLARELKDSGYFALARGSGGSGSSSGSSSEATDTSLISLGSELSGDISSTERRELAQLLAVSRGKERLNATLGRLLSEKDSLQLRLSRAVAALREIANEKDVQCAQLSDAILVKAPVDADAMRKEWKHECVGLSYPALYGDYHCDQMWRRMLAHADVTSVDNVIGKFAYITVATEEHGLFDSSPTWAAQVVAYHLDRDLGFYRTPAVVSRALQRHTLVRAARSADIATKVQSELHDGLLPGAVAGWTSKDQIQVLQRPIPVYIDQWFAHVNVASVSAICLELISYVLWSFLTDDVTRFNRNFALTRDEDFEGEGGGMLFYMENVGSWASTGHYDAALSPDQSGASAFCSRSGDEVTCKSFSTIANAANYTEVATATEYASLLRSVCIFPADIAERLLKYDSSSLLDRINQEPLDVEPTALLGLNARLGAAKKWVSTCIDTYGEDKVLLNGRFA